MSNNIIAPLLRPAVCLIIGIMVGRFVECHEVILLVTLLATLAAAFLLRKFQTLQSLYIQAACMVMGCLLCLHQKSQLQVAWPSGEHSYAVIVSSEAVERGKTLSMDALLATTGQKIQLRIMHDERSQQLHVGDGLIIHSAIKPLSAQGSYRTWLETHAYVGETFVWQSRWKRESVSLNDIGAVSRARLFFLQQRHELLSNIPTQEGQEGSSILAAMTLGDKHAVSPEQKEQFSVAGTSHLLALSGLHLGIIYMLLSLLFRSRRWQLLSQLLIIASVWSFVLLVGMPSSVVRAAVMITIYAFVSLLNRRKTPVNTLALTAIVMLVSNPYALFDVGFQLSFAAVLSILLFVPVFSSLFTTRQNSLFGRLTGSLLSMTYVTVAAQIGTAPLVAFYFGRFSVWFLLANYLAIPLATLILYTMFFALLLSFWPAVQSAVIVIPATLASWLNQWTAWVASLPFASIDGLQPSPLQVAMVYVVIAGAYYLLHYRRQHDIKQKLS